MNRTVELLPPDRQIVLDVLGAYLPADVSVWVFGSRATGTARRYSDLDLAVAGERPLDPAVLGALRDALSESDLTIKVDVVDLLDVDPAFRRLIEGDMVRLPAGSSE